MDIRTAWVKPPPQVGGLDHLAVQAPCISVYGRLLPGITNVTDRARYYSFYPWLLWAFDKRGYTKFDDDFVERFRRADCLFSLIAERHAAVSEDAREDHATAVVGSNTLSPVANGLDSGGSTTLSKYSLRTGADIRYFKNKLGGLGQYYLGVLRELAILDGDTSSGVRYTRQVGQFVAEHMGEGFNGELFMDVVESDLVSAKQLDDLSGLCPCQLTKNIGEASILSDLFFVRSKFYDVDALPRRRSLQLILHLAGELLNEEIGLYEETFRGCAYAGALPSGKPWLPPISLLNTKEKWAIYSRNELLSIAVQGLFTVLLDAYQESGLHFDSSAEVADWFVSQPEAIQALVQLGPDHTLSTCINTCGTWLPPLAEWTHATHEVMLAEDIAQLSRQASSEESRRDIVVASLRVLVALAHRKVGHENPYGDMIFDESFFRYYPINLVSFNAHTASTWSSLTMCDLLRWLLLNWGIELHLRVALRKLRGQSQSTFRIRPTEDRGLEVIEVPPAVHTRPRFNQAVRVLRDIGALKRVEKDGVDNWIPSDLGLAMLELGDAP